jgi:aldehyde:ferredoxin oxidoreductase
MGQLAGFYNGRIALVDLSAGSVEVSPLPEDLLFENIGGAAVNNVLYQKYGEGDPVVLGTGPLTGSFAPASCLMVATFHSSSGEVHHVPFIRDAGADLKFSGIDFVVIQGKAPRLSAIEMKEGNINIADAERIGGLEIPEAQEALTGPNRLGTGTMLLTGPAADSGSAAACLSIGMWGSMDKVSLGWLMASKNLKAIIMDASMGISFPDFGNEPGHAMTRAVKDVLGKTKKAPFAVFEMMNVNSNAMSLLKRYHRRSYACYHCPFPCTSYLEFKLKDPTVKRKPKRKEGLFLLDHTGFYALAKKRGPQSLALMRECLHLGVDPVSAAKGLPVEGSSEDALQSVRELARIKEAREVNRKPEAVDLSLELQSAGIRPESYQLFGGGIPFIKREQGRDRNGVWERRVAMAMVMGICPLFTLAFPQIKAPDLLGLVSKEGKDVEYLLERLGALVSSLVLQRSGEFATNNITIPNGRRARD